MDTTEDTAAAPKAPAKTPQPTEAEAAKAAAVDALVEGWVAALRDGPIAHNTPAWNALTSALPGLKAAIIGQGG